ncbi:hypothetical protein COW36_07310 [bacterium (Candidatus Blackallbacteria) CG17_big_fil_post_rev_8_21_14_2_50_48_46]|uniref:Uncharacterized protein n=1 Tax=bacterium (Candidatus Blackallbacteria) CG17_big_fil_post_rev_8_21_14_2_50_48_46 TaxID=2014261 RepID=A0A2M7G733_9BACT|nr:MAG: hypothetical protein COW64_06820 [bacterium (Candidatus Blackallbacteria) CG18_big_fil_WC_8_21_14_2_50_49_26]PIW17870.1 MAG: hypothetical protein COW36_07310 [bacterium (Candidatus Blackallbacteria) CG17_big_fil_post_rev_8_21_14_2_50_48_46]PIW48546.1 MAG: hypothetical protein COW20_09265 [bacterium (Candidatus Blackallbacteria) CG13_big_fil_rev_8_21_14_2_50_49_14]
MSGISSFFSSFVDSFQAGMKSNAPAPPPAAPAPPPATPPAPPKDQAELSKVSTAPAAAGAPKQVTFGGSVSAEPLPKVANAQEALAQLRQIGFITGSAGREAYHYEKLSGQSADTIRHLQSVFSRDSQGGRDHSTTQFALRVVGATLSRPEERQRFIKTGLLNSKDADTSLDQMSRILRLKPDAEIAKALKNSLGLASEKQTQNFLYKSGFLMADSMEENGPTIHKKNLQHLPPAIVEQLIQNLNKGGILSQNAPIVNALKHLH